MKYVYLTRPSGKVIAVHPNWVSVVEYDEGHKLTRIEIGDGLYYWVTEQMVEVIARCETNADSGQV